MCVEEVWTYVAMMNGFFGWITDRDVPTVLGTRLKLDKLQQINAVLDMQHAMDCLRTQVSLLLSPVESCAAANHTVCA